MASTDEKMINLLSQVVKGVNNLNNSMGSTPRQRADKHVGRTRAGGTLNDPELLRDFKKLRREIMFNVNAIEQQRRKNKEILKSFGALISPINNFKKLLASSYAGKNARTTSIKNRIKVAEEEKKLLQDQLAEVRRRRKSTRAVVNQIKAVDDKIKFMETELKKATPKSTNKATDYIKDKIASERSMHSIFKKTREGMQEQLRHHSDNHQAIAKNALEVFQKKASEGTSMADAFGAIEKMNDHFTNMWTQMEAAAGNFEKLNNAGAKGIKSKIQKAQKAQDDLIAERASYYNNPNDRDADLNAPKTSDAYQREIDHFAKILKKLNDDAAALENDNLGYKQDWEKFLGSLSEMEEQKLSVLHGLNKSDLEYEKIVAMNVDKQKEIFAILDDNIRGINSAAASFEGGINRFRIANKSHMDDIKKFVASLSAAGAILGRGATETAMAMQKYTVNNTDSLTAAGMGMSPAELIALQGQNKDVLRQMNAGDEGRTGSQIADLAKYAKMFGVHGKEAAELAVNMADVNRAMGGAPESLKNFMDSQKILSDQAGMTADDLMQFNKELIAGGVVANLLSTHLEKSASERDKALQDEISKRYRLNKLMGLSAEQIKQQMLLNSNKRFAGIAAAVNETVGRNMAYSAYNARNPNNQIGNDVFSSIGVNDRNALSAKELLARDMADIKVAQDRLKIYKDNERQGITAAALDTVYNVADEKRGFSADDNNAAIMRANKMIADLSLVFKRDIKPEELFSSQMQDALLNNKEYLAMQIGKNSVDAGATATNSNSAVDLTRLKTPVDMASAAIMDLGNAAASATDMIRGALKNPLVQSGGAIADVVGNAANAYLALKGAKAITMALGTNAGRAAIVATASEVAATVGTTGIAASGAALAAAGATGLGLGALLNAADKASGGDERDNKIAKNTDGWQYYAATTSARLAKISSYLPVAVTGTTTYTFDKISEMFSGNIEDNTKAINKLNETMWQNVKSGVRTSLFAGVTGGTVPVKQSSTLSPNRLQPNVNTSLTALDSNMDSLGKAMQASGFKVDENHRFGGVTPYTHKGRGHDDGRAFDVNYPGGGAAEQQKLSALRETLRPLEEAGKIKTLFGAAEGHPTHMHVEIKKAFADDPTLLADLSAAFPDYAKTSYASSDNTLSDQTVNLTSPEMIKYMQVTAENTTKANEYTLDAKLMAARQAQLTGDWNAQQKVNDAMVAANDRHNALTSILPSPY